MGTDRKEQIARRVAEEVDKLPPMPGNIIELRRAAADPNVEFSRLIPLLARDPGLSANLLKFANSARYGIDHSVDTLEEAVRYFGMGNLVNYVAASFSDSVVKKNFSSIKGLDRYFAHSREISSASRTLTTFAGMNRHGRETVSLVGLLHDIGRLVLMLSADQTALPLMGASADRMADIVAEEQDLWGIDHCAVGAQICRKWRFPELFEKSILRHHTPFQNNDLAMESAFVFLAHIITVEGLTQKMIVSALTEDALSKMGLTPATVAEANLAFFESARP